MKEELSECARSGPFKGSDERRVGCLSSAFGSFRMASPEKNDPLIHYLRAARDRGWQKRVSVG